MDIIQVRWRAFTKLLKELNSGHMQLLHVCQISYMWLVNLLVIWDSESEVFACFYAYVLPEIKVMFKILSPIWTYIKIIITTYCIYYKLWDEITYLLPNFNGATIEVWEWINNIIAHLTGHVITYPCLD